MGYAIVKDGETYDLPKYSMKIADKLESVENQSQKNVSFRIKCKARYDTVSELLGKEVVNTLLGKFEDSDPNEINILYLNIIQEYNKPIEEHNSAAAKEKMNDIDIDKMTELLKSLSGSEKILNKLK